MTDIVQPDWMRDYEPQPNTPPRGWLPGQSGNPKGRPPGSRNKKNVIAEEFAKDGSAVARVVVDAALAGDMQAANMVLSRISPALRSQAERVVFDFDATAPAVQQVEQVLAAIADGKVAPDVGRQIIEAIGSLSAVRAVEILEQRIAALEEKAP